MNFVFINLYRFNSGVSKIVQHVYQIRLVFQNLERCTFYNFVSFQWNPWLNSPKPTLQKSQKPARYGTATRQVTGSEAI